MQNLKPTKRRNDKSHRESLYKKLMLIYRYVPCYVCKQHVEEEDASLEHKVPLYKGGDYSPRNLAISHIKCNQTKSKTE